jgi:hypothetical protein
MSNLAEEFRKTWLIALIGIVLFIGGTGVLIYNEGRAISLSLTLEEGFFFLI